MQHDLRYEVLASRTPEGEAAKAAIYWWCICGKYQSQSTIVDKRAMVQSFLGHLDKESLIPLAPPISDAYRRSERPTIWYGDGESARGPEMVKETR